MLAAGRDTESHAMLLNDARQRRSWRMAIERLLLLHVLLGEPIQRRAWKFAEQRGVNRLAQPKHAGREILDDDRAGEAIDDEAAQIIAFRMDQPIGVGDRSRVSSARGAGRSHFGCDRR